MDLFFFFLSVVFFWLVTVLMVLFALLLILLWIGGEANEMIIFFLLLLAAPPYFLDKLVSHFRGKRQVDKFYSKRQYRRTLQSIQERGQGERNRLSKDAAQKNAQPLVSMATQELRKSRNYVTPAIFSRVEAKLSTLLKNGDIPAVNNVYEILIKSKPDNLNQELMDLLAKLELRR